VLVLSICFGKFDDASELLFPYANGQSLPPWKIKGKTKVTPKEKEGNGETKGQNNTTWHFG
jgi:hypothetical protein